MRCVHIWFQRLLNAYIYFFPSNKGYQHYVSCLPGLSFLKLYRVYMLIESVFGRILKSPQLTRGLHSLGCSVTAMVPTLLLTRYAHKSMYQLGVQECCSSSSATALKVLRPRELSTTQTFHMSLLCIVKLALHIHHVLGEAAQLPGQRSTGMFSLVGCNFVIVLEPVLCFRC